MLPLYDMLANAQNGQAMEALARQFNLSQQQTQAAVAALLPAFSQGLKHNASDPYGVGAFLGALATGQHAKYFEDAQAALSPAGMAEGNGILGHLFGSKDLSRAVAAQAAQATGIGQEVMKQMLPAIAAMIMGGLFKQTTGQLGGQPGGGFGGGFGGGGTGNPFADMMAEMMKQGGAMMGGARPEPAPPAPGPMDNPFGKMFQDMLTGMAGQPAPKPRPTTPDSPFGDNPLGRMFEEMMNAGRPAATPAPEPREKANPSGRPRTPYDDLFGEMFETGAKQRDDYQENMKSVFDQFLKGMDRHR